MTEPRKIDRNAHRWGAGISAVLLLVGFVFDWHAVVPAMAAALGVGPVFGLRYSPLGATYRAIKRTFRLNVGVEPEDEAPPRFAQALGFACLGLGTLAFWPLGWNTAGWALALLVAGLQALLAGTGLCVGCEIYRYSLRFAAKEA